VTTKNPFPGMNPFFEQQWRDAHASLITYLRDALQERLPPDLIIRAEEEVVAIGGSESKTTYRPGVQVREPWTLREPDVAEMTGKAPLVTPATELIRVLLDEEVQRRLEIRETTGRLITVLELVSPTNKIESAERDRCGGRPAESIGKEVQMNEVQSIGEKYCEAGTIVVAREAGQKSPPAARPAPDQPRPFRIRCG
jgi:hypothetical protein